MNVYRYIINNDLMWTYYIKSEQHELFLDASNDIVRNYLQNIEPYSFGQRSALAEDHYISFFYLETRTHMHWEVAVSLFESVIFFYVMKIISSHYYCSVHLGWYYHTFKNLIYIIIYSIIKCLFVLFYFIFLSFNLLFL
jgi:hypothetical protein